MYTSTCQMETQREKGEGFAERLGSLPHGYSLQRTVMTRRTIGKGLKEAVYVAQGGVLAYHVAAPGFDPPYQKGEKKEAKPKNSRSRVLGRWRSLCFAKSGVTSQIPVTGQVTNTAHPQGLC